ncbi:MAG TPA: glycosyltransferase family 4 protein [Vicinamibacterales bacterium]|nr:glycosyltransferase family 4 protein [Vicinamibacterales bacterium]
MLLRCLAMMRGGGETRHMAWMRELTAMGVDVEVVTGGPLFGSMRYPVTDVGCRDTTVIKSPYMRDLVYKTQGKRGLGRIGVAMLHTDEEWFCKLAWQHIAGESASARRKPDIVHAHALHQAARLKTIDVPVAINLPGQPHSRYIPDLQKADVLLSDGWGARRLPAILGRPVENITKGVDSTSFSPGGANARVEARVGDAPVVLCVSRLVPIKNVALFVDAMAVVHRARPDARGIIVGEGPLEQTLRQQAAALGLERVLNFAGYVDQPDLPPWYRAADVFVLSSDFDNSPNVVLEAMATGLPVVGTDVGGVADFVEAPAGGALVPKGDAAAMGTEILALLNDEAGRRQAGGFNRERATKKFSWRTSAEQLLAAYERAMAARAA